MAAEDGFQVSNIYFLASYQAKLDTSSLLMWGSRPPVVAGLRISLTFLLRSDSGTRQ